MTSFDLGDPGIRVNGYLDRGRLESAHTLHSRYYLGPSQWSIGSPNRTSAHFSGRLCYPPFLDRKCKRAEVGRLFARHTLGYVGGLTPGAWSWQVRER